MPDTAVKEKILAAVEAGFDEQIRFLQDFVRIPSTRGNEAPAQDFMARALRSRGYDVDHWKIEEDDIKGLPGFSPVMDTSYDAAYTVVGTHRPKQTKGRSLILQGHLDVVPEGPHDMWETPPYEPAIRDGWMYGRGAGDMKSGTVSALFAMDALKRAGFEPAATVHFQSVIEEECTGNGCLSTLQRGYRADFALVPEPSGLTLTRAQVGVIWFKLKVKGWPVHVAYAGTGSNAIEATFHLVNAMHELEAKWEEEARKEPYFDKLDRCINMNIGQIEGGDWASSVPAWCTAWCRIGILPGWSIEERQREIEQKVREASLTHPFLSNNPPEVLWSGFLADGYVLKDGESEAEKVLADVHQDLFGEPLDMQRVATALNDTRFYGLYYDIPSTCYGPKCELAHGFNERVNIQSIKDCTKAIACFIADWCDLNAA